MPERTEDGQWRWGNIRRKTKKELAQTVYGIWVANGSKGSFHDFYYYGDENYSKKHKKELKEIVEQLKLNCLSKPKKYSFFTIKKDN